MGRNLIVGDIHSRYEKLISVLEKASYNPSADTLYSVGDFCDRGKEAVKTLRFLMDQKNLKAVVGNHDIMLQNWLYTGLRDDHWLRYLGGNRTVQDIVYRNLIKHAECTAIASWLHSLPLVRVEDRYIVVHGGIPYRFDIDDLVSYQEMERPVYGMSSSSEALVWDRDYMLSAYVCVNPEMRDEIDIDRDPFDTDKTIFVGHTPIPEGKPFISEEYHLVALDTGAGRDGPLTLMDMDTLEYWQA